ncbi:hypothetical protein IW261DRAFT_484216 [Armillaria novae-zelandiae]|uniref:Uncharacterized protein n=1 Tax=Armillaria novae-zelandiae TaxID=153914 RepID=A0AA39P0W9_9AGAR|nr:hypothetical protein IW261DRAFT_484216 [Armillaria novae-zelandiae]
MHFICVQQFFLLVSRPSKIRIFAFGNDISRLHWAVCNMTSSLLAFVIPYQGTPSVSEPRGQIVLYLFLWNYSVVTTFLGAFHYTVIRCSALLSDVCY